MKNRIILGAIFAVLTLNSCESSNINEELYEEEFKMVDPDDDGTIDPDDEDDRY